MHCSLVDREYKRYILKDNSDLCYLRHASGVVVVTLNKNHEAFEKGVKSVEWQTKNSKGVDRSKNKVRGRSKKVNVLLNFSIFFLNKNSFHNFSSFCLFH